MLIKEQFENPRPWTQISKIWTAEIKKKRGGLF